MNRVLNGILTWVFIAGGALTIADYWSNSLNLTDGAQGLMKHWRAAMHNLWMSLGSTSVTESEIYLGMALSLMLCYWLIAALSGVTHEQTNRETYDDFDLSFVYLIVALVLFTSTVAAFIASYQYIFIIFDNIFVFVAFTYVVVGSILTRIIGGIAYAAIYTVLDDYIKLTISPDKEFGAAVCGQLISIFVVFSPLIFISNTTVLTRRISNMLLSAAVIAGLGGTLKLFKELKPGTVSDS